MMTRSAPLFLACLLGTSAAADCSMLPDALPPTDEAQALAERLSVFLPLASMRTEVRTVSACGPSVYLGYIEYRWKPDQIAPSNRLPDAERVICMNFFTRQFITEGGSLKGIALASSYVFDLCEGS
jgi:hypothetical protein